MTKNNTRFTGISPWKWCLQPVGDLIGYFHQIGRAVEYSLGIMKDSVNGISLPVGRCQV